MSKQDYSHSVTVRCKDIEVLYCLRGLSMFSQKEGNVYVPWGGTSEEEWESNDKQVTFRFTKGAYRQMFIDAANRVLIKGSFEEIERKNDDPPPVTTKEFINSLRKRGINI